MAKTVYRVEKHNYSMVRVPLSAREHIAELMAAKYPDAHDYLLTKSKGCSKMLEVERIIQMCFDNGLIEFKNDTLTFK